MPTELNKLINFLIKVFFFTSLWVIIFISLVGFLNFFYPPVLKDIFYRPAAAFPEYFEMPLYLILTFLFVMTIWIVHKLKNVIPNLFLDLPRHSHESGNLFNRFLVKSVIASLIKIIILLFLLLVFVSKLTKFPMADDLYPYSLRPNSSIYLLVLFLYLAFFSFVIFESVVLSRLIKNKKLFTFIFYGGALVVASVLTFEPRFPISSHEYGYFFGPMWEVIKGKTLFTDIATDYGFYATLFFTALYKVGLFKFSQLPIYVWLAFVAQYFLCFYLIYKLSRSLTLSLIGLFSIITVNYFSFFVLPITITQYSAMRRLPSIFLLFLLYKFKRFDSRFLLLLAITDFWIVDSGISILLAFGFTLFILVLSKLMTLKNFLKTLLLLTLFQIGVFILINGLHVIFGYKPINPLDILRSLRQHAGLGLTMLPMRPHNFFWIVILIYFASIIYFFRKITVKAKIPFLSSSWEVRRRAERDEHAQLSEKNGIELSLLLFSANLSLFNALYFVGRSHEANLIDISVLVLLNFFILVAVVRSSLNLSFRKLIILYSLLFIIFIIYPAYSRRYHVTEFLLWKFKRITEGNVFTPETDQILEKTFSQDVNLIKRHLKDGEIVILSKEETYLLLLSGKKNLLDVNPQSGIDTVSEMNIATKRVVERCPPKIAADCRLFKKCPDYQSYSQKSLFMAPFILESIEKKCQIRYQPTECTDKLCIAQLTK